MSSPFRLTILDADGNVLGDSPITTATSLTTVDRLDSIGQLTFTMPAGDPITRFIHTGVQFDVQDVQDGDLGRYFFATRRVDDRSGDGRLTVTAYDTLIELTRTTLGFRRRYGSVEITAIVTDLLGVVDGWTAEADDGLGMATLTFEGENPLQALDALRERFALHYRRKQGADRVLQFGNLGTSNGWRLLNRKGAPQAVIAAQNHVALIDGLTEIEDGESLVNQIVALGAGQGAAQLTMEGATAGIHALQNAANVDGSVYYFVEDELSRLNYGARLRVMRQSSARTNQNTTADKVLAADSLKLAAEAYLNQHAAPRREYSLTVTNLPPTLHVGDSAHLVYRAARDGFAYLDVDETVYVLEVRRSRQASGERHVSLTVSTVADQRPRDRDVLVAMTRQLEVLRTHVQPAPYNLLIQASGDVSTTLRLRLPVDSLVLNLIQVRLHFDTDSAFTGRVQVYVNGVNRSRFYGGPWTGGTEIVDVTIDITNDIVNAVGGLYRTHIIQLTSKKSGTLNADLRVTGVAQAIVAE